MIHWNLFDEKIKVVSLTARVTDCSTTRKRISMTIRMRASRTYLALGGGISINATAMTTIVVPCAFVNIAIGIQELALALSHTTHKFAYQSQSKPK
jgi:hypothetical protein